MTTTTTTHPAPNEPVVLHLKMQPPWMYIDEIRRFVESFCAVACPSSDREAHLGLATHELVQNALVNGAEPGIELRLAVDAARDRVEVAVTNLCRPGQVELLRARLAGLYAHRDALAGYLAAMSENPRERGGLGLARIRCEATLDLEVEAEGDRLTVRASGPLRVAGPMRLAS